MPSKAVKTVLPIGATSLVKYDSARPSLAELMQTAQTARGRRLTERAITWRKTYNNLGREFSDKEIYLNLVDDDRDPAQVIYNRLLKLSYKVEGYLRHENRVMVEVAREFVREGREPEIVPTIEFRGVRGTKRRDETDKRAIQREVEEEVGIRLALNRFEPIPDLRFNPYDKEHWRDSTVYRHVLALDISKFFQVWVRRPKLERFVTKPDNGVKVHFEWRDLQELGPAAKMFLDSAVIKVLQTP